MPVRNRFAEWLPELTAWRRDFHAHPELEFDLPRTAERVASRLRDFGCDEVVTGLGQSGVVGLIRGAGAGRCIGLRADMDALPIHEATGAPHKSTLEGRMHACGHDGHTTMLLAAARYLAENRNFCGSVAVIFQPAEEQGGGGRAMIEDGLMERFAIDEVYGMHNMPGLPVGQFAIRSGAMMASVDDFTIEVTGQGGHAARPHDCVDPVLVGSQIVVALQSVIARNLDPLKSGVVSVTTFHQDSVSHNVIPHSVTLLGTCRALDPDIRSQLHERIRDIAEQTAQMMGAQATVSFDFGYPVTVNDPEATKWAAEAAASVSSEPVDQDIAPSMGAEDFSYMLEARPGAYILTGNGDSAMIHHPEYDFNDEAIPFGASWFVEMVERRLGRAVPASSLAGEEITARKSA